MKYKNDWQGLEREEGRINWLGVEGEEKGLVLLIS